MAGGVGSLTAPVVPVSPPGLPGARRAVQRSDMGMFPWLMLSVGPSSHKALHAGTNAVGRVVASGGAASTVVSNP